MGRIVISLLTLGVLACGSPSRQTLPVEETLKKAEKKIAADIDSFKKMPENPFFAQTDAPLTKQQELAALRVETVKKLLKPGGTDSPDYGQILQLNTDILVKAPDTKSARMAHWDIYTYNMICGNTHGAKEALMTYLHKYEAEKDKKKEAFDKLGRFCSR